MTDLMPAYSELVSEDHPMTDNVARLALHHGRRSPHRVAILCEDDRGAVRQVTFGDLLTRAEHYAQGLTMSGVRVGDRIALLFRPCTDFYALLLAALAQGHVVVLVDASLSRSGIRRALRTAAPSMVVTSRRVLRWWPLIPELRHIRRVSTDGWTLGATDLLDLRSGGRLPILDADVADCADAVISFTSGTGGAPTAARRSHNLLLAQHRALTATFPVTEGTHNMPFFPLVTLHNLCCGVTTVLPSMDPRHPTDLAVARTVDAIEKWQVDDLCAAPDALDRLAAVVETGGTPIQRVRRIAVGGGPVDRPLGRRIQRAFPNAAVEVVYGCTEAEPIAVVALGEIQLAQGDGCLVGAPVPEVEVVLASLPPAVSALDTATVNAHAVADGDVGEVIVRGAHVLAPAAARQLDATHWHRTGDLARRDDRGRLWLLGRTGDAVVHRGRVLFPLEVENAAREVEGVKCVALVTCEGAPEGLLVVTLERGTRDAEVLHRLGAMLNSRGLSELPIRRVEIIPTDARHRSKIDRITLRAQLRASAL